MTEYLAQNADEGTFTPAELFAGEEPIVTRGGETVALGQNLAAKQIVAMNEDGELVAWAPTTGAATGLLTFTGVGTANDTVTINGQAITLVAASAATYEATIGGTATLTAQAVKTIINAHPDVFGVVASGAAAALTLTAIEPGVAGNSITTAESGTNTTIGAVTLTGGSEETEAKPYGVLIEAINATSVAKTGATCYHGGVFNHAALTWPAGLTTFAARKLALYRGGADFKIDKLG
jgi:hypothetical protein